MTYSLYLNCFCNIQEELVFNESSFKTDSYIWRWRIYIVIVRPIFFKKSLSEPILTLSWEVLSDYISYGMLGSRIYTCHRDDKQDHFIIGRRRENECIFGFPFCLRRLQWAIQDHTPLGLDSCTLKYDIKFYINE